ncbi:MAG: hypothetical protein LBT59_15710, partial [Clostridiales bacterium]|nr:hypothetical protein [Clostridiales bacterium]
MDESVEKFAKSVVAACKEEGTERLRELIKDVYGRSIELMLDKEMDEHLGYTKHDGTGDKT